MKIGLVAENYYPTLGGIQEHIYYLAHWLVKQGHFVRVITGDPRVSVDLGPAEDPWVTRVGPSYRYGVMGTYTQATLGIKAARNFKECIDECQFDLLHIHGPCDIGIPLMAYAFFKGPKIATLHSAFAHGSGRTLMSPFYKWVMKKLSGVIAVSELAAQVMLRYASFSYRVIPNGVDVKYFSQGRPWERFNDGLFNILYLGRIEPRNGLDLLLKAFPQILAQIPDARLIVAGGGPQEKEYLRLIPVNLKDRVVFLGPIYKDRPDLYANANVFVVPARKGGTFSIMILEALASRVPVVATPIVPYEQRNSHWETVYVAKDHNPEDIAQSIINVALDDFRSEKIKRGFEIVQQYDWPLVASSILSYYEEVLKAHV